MPSQENQALAKSFLEKYRAALKRYGITPEGNSLPKPDFVVHKKCDSWRIKWETQKTVVCGSGHLHINPSTLKVVKKKVKHESKKNKGVKKEVHG